MDNKNNGDQSSALPEGNGPAKKRKLETVEKYLSDVELQTLEFQNRSLKELVQRLGNDCTNIDEQRAKIIQLEDTVTKLQKEKAQNEIDYTAKMKVIENEKEALANRVRALNEDVLLMHNVKAEIKGSADNERRIFIDRLKKLNTEISVLRNNNFGMEQSKQKLDPHKNDAETMRKQKEVAEKKIKDLEFNIQCATDFKQVIMKKVEEERKSFVSLTGKLKAEVNDLKEKNLVLEKKAQEDKVLLSVREIKIKEIEKKYHDANASIGVLKEKDRKMKDDLKKEATKLNKIIESMKSNVSRNKDLGTQANEGSESQADIALPFTISSPPPENREEFRYYTWVNCYDAWRMDAGKDLVGFDASPWSSKVIQLCYQVIKNDDDVRLCNLYAFFRGHPSYYDKTGENFANNEKPVLKYVNLKASVQYWATHYKGAHNVFQLWHCAKSMLDACVEAEKVFEVVSPC